MPPSRDDLDRLVRLRELFLGSRDGGALGDYWRDREDLAAYDAVLGARIGWKWDAALQECRERGLPRADGMTVLDFGCGTGAAAVRFAAAFGAGTVLCHDRSAAARAFAVAAVAQAHPGVVVRELADPADAAPDVVLVSHVLSELDERSLAGLLALLQRARQVVIVEAGDRATSRRLGALRAALLPQFQVVAPCPHAGACPALQRDRDWCHFFASPPVAVFTDGDWVRTARALGIDLRALPYSFLALTQQRPAAAPPPHRLLGRPLRQRRGVRVQLCTVDGLAERAIDKRDRALFRLLTRHASAVRALP